MSWAEIDNKILKRTDSYFVYFSDKLVMDFIKKVIKEEFPNINENSIDKAMSECCKAMITPIPRTRFLKCLKEKLG